MGALGGTCLGAMTASWCDDRTIPERPTTPVYNRIRAITVCVVDSSRTHKGAARPIHLMREGANQPTWRGSVQNCHLLTVPLGGSSPFPSREFQVPLPPCPANSLLPAGPPVPQSPFSHHDHHHAPRPPPLTPLTHTSQHQPELPSLAQPPPLTPASSLMATASSRRPRSTPIEIA